LAFGGNLPGSTGATEEYNGSAWTSNPTGLNTIRDGLVGCGTQTAGLAFGGYDPVSVTGATEEYDGSTWTTVNPMNTGSYQLGGAGTQPAALAFGGNDPGAFTAATEEWAGAGSPLTKTITAS
jgi:hypothetical protein